MKHRHTQDLFAYWDGLRGKRPAPTRGEIDPTAIIAILPDVFMLDCEPGQTAQIRLAGTRLCDLFGGELRGRGFDDLWPTAERADISEPLSSVTMDLGAVILGARALAADGQAWPVEVLLLPLGPAPAPHVIGIVSADPMPPWFLTRPATGLQLVSFRLIGAAHVKSTADPSKERPALAHARARRKGRFMVYEGGEP